MPFERDLEEIRESCRRARERIQDRASILRVQRLCRVSVGVWGRVKASVVREGWARRDRQRGWGWRSREGQDCQVCVTYIFSKWPFLSLLIKCYAEKVWTESPKEMPSRIYLQFDVPLLGACFFEHRHSLGNQFTQLYSRVLFPLVSTLFPRIWSNSLPGALLRTRQNVCLHSRIVYLVICQRWE